MTGVVDAVIRLPGRRKSGNRAVDRGRREEGHRADHRKTTVVELRLALDRKRRLRDTARETDRIPDLPAEARAAARHVVRLDGLGVELKHARREEAKTTVCRVLCLAPIHKHTSTRDRRRCGHNVHVEQK